MSTSRSFHCYKNTISILRLLAQGSWFGYISIRDQALILFWQCRWIITEYTVTSCKPPMMNVHGQKGVLGPVHYNALLFENAYVLIYFCLSFTLERPKTLMKMETFQNGFKSGVVWTGEKEAFENGDEKSITHCRFHQYFRAF